MVRGYKELVVWCEAHRFVLDVYRVTEDFPKHELYGLISQLRRAAVSIPTNIVEGHAKKSRKDCCRFLDISHGSLNECSYLLELSRDLGYLSGPRFDEIDKQLGKVGYLLYRFTQSTASRNP